MKHIICLFLLLSVGPTLTYACDEECRKSQAAARNGVNFSSYLNRKYCNDIAMEFMTSTMKSLQSYRFNQLETRHRGGMNNTRHFLVQRREWLQECDQYLSLTDYGRIFKDEKTTKGIMTAIKEVSEELEALVNGVTYTRDVGVDSTTVAGEKFDNLFKLVDQHKTLLQLKGQFVIR